jgi:N-acetyl-anhydromuramyl-L-alanine amidase AmpD
MYAELIKYGFEYALVEYNAIQIKLVHKISVETVPRFLIAAHPKNKYDPGKLFDIWKAKIGDKSKRNQEIMKSMIDDFYDVRGQINEKYVLLKDHIKRIQNSAKKYGGK